MANKTLGRGLSAFLSTQESDNDRDEILKINIDQIQPNPYQPRQFFDEEQLQALATSIKNKGILQPILVQKLSENSYQLIAGERRLRAAKLAGLSELPAILTNMDKQNQLEVAILENVQRENLNPIEEAESYRRLIDEFQRTQEELSEIIGKSRSHISNIMRLLTLPEDVKELIKQGKLSFGHARAIVGTSDASMLAKKIIQKSLNVRDTEILIKTHKGRNSVPIYTDPEILNLTSQLSQLSGLEVNLKLKRKGGIIELYFSDFSQLDTFIQKLNK